MTKLNRLLSCDKENVCQSTMWNSIYYSGMKKRISKNIHNDIIWILGDSKVSKLIS